MKKKNFHAKTQSRKVIAKKNKRSQMIRVIIIGSKMFNHFDYQQWLDIYKRNYFAVTPQLPVDYKPCHVGNIFLLPAHW